MYSYIYIASYVYVLAIMHAYRAWLYIYIWLGYTGPDMMPPLFTIITVHDYMDHCSFLLTLIVG